MIILIPLGGIGRRFKKEGYTIPKALINVNGKPILYYLLDNLNLNNIDFVYIPYNKEYSIYIFEDKLIKDYPKYKFKFLELNENTEGAAETIYKALNDLFLKDIRYPIGVTQMKEMFDKPVLCIDGDNFYTDNIIKIWNGENVVFSFTNKSKDAKFSFLKTQKDETITDIIEKEKISNIACTGAYGFKSYYKLM